MARQAAPWPWDCSINGAGYKLVADNQDLAWSEHRVAEVEQSLPLHEEDVQFTLTPPRVETPYVVNDLSGGMGGSLQMPSVRSRYELAENVDCSSGMAVKGPALTQVQTNMDGTTNSFHCIVQFNATMYMAIDNAIWKYDNITTGLWAQVGTDLAANVSGRMVAFRGTQTGEFLFIPVGASNHYYVLSTSDVRTQHASQNAEGFVVVNDELYLHNTESQQQVIRKSTDGGTAATWGGVTTIGDAKFKITWMHNVGGRLICIKEDGLYGPTIQDESVIDRQLTPELAGLHAADAGVRSVVFNGRLVFRMRNRLFTYDADSGAIEDITPSVGSGGAFTINTSETYELTVQPGVCVWATMKVSGLTNALNLFRWGGWRQTAQDGTPRREFVPAWHGSVVSIGSVPIGAIHFDNAYSDGVAEPSAGTIARSAYLWIKQQTNGTIYKSLIARTPVPAEDAEYSVTASAGYIYYPRWTLNTPLESKVLRRVGLSGRNLSSDRSLAAHYRTTIGGSWTAINSGTNTVIAEPGTTIAATGTPVAKSLDFRVTIAGSAGTSYARLDALAIYAAVRSNAYKEIVCQVLTCDNVKDRQGSPTRRSGRDLRDALETAIDGNPFTLIAPSGESMTVLGLDYDHKLEGYDSTGVARYRTTLRMVEAS